MCPSQIMPERIRVFDQAQGGAELPHHLGMGQSFVVGEFQRSPVAGRLCSGPPALWSLLGWGRSLIPDGPSSSGVRHRHALGGHLCTEPVSLRILGASALTTLASSPKA
jgi:hypothetical protein